MLNSSISFFTISDASCIFDVFVLATTKVKVLIFICVLLSVNSPHHWGSLKDFVKKHWGKEKIFSHAWGEKNKIVGVHLRTSVFNLLKILLKIC